jgi:predicted ATPase
MVNNMLDESKVFNDVIQVDLDFFQIIGLFNRYSIQIPFEKVVNIFIGENGLGKTTILNCFYYVLEKKFVKLATLPFSEIRVKFRSDEKIYTITQADLIAFNNQTRSKYERYNNLYVENFMTQFMNNEKYSSIQDLRDSEEFIILVHRYSQEIGIPFSIAEKRIINYISSHEDNNTNIKRSGDRTKVVELSSAISKRIKDRIIYLPTYRRIEDDLSILNIRSEDINNSELQIRFGMSDVQTSIDKILNDIRSEAMRGFREMTGVLLRQYADGEDIFKSSMNRYNIDVNMVKIVLDRVGDEIQEEYKQKIINIMKSEKIFDFEYIYLINLLNKLVVNYEFQRQYDDRITSFVSTCNKYLRDKYLDYNQSTLSLNIFLKELNNESSKSLSLTQMSSGEKQIISLFAKLYLDSNEKSIIIIDEPELSLSLEWQQMLLPDIIRTGNCSLLFTVTHSPFIFENEFDFYAKEMRKYIKIV